MPKTAAPCIALLSTAISMDYLVKPFQRVVPDIDLRIGRSLEDLGNLDQIEAAVCWHPPQGALARLTNLRLMQSLAAGIEHITSDPSLPQAIPLCRIVDPGMASGMKAYVAWAVSHQQRFMPAYLKSRSAQQWVEQPIVSPAKHRVGIAGLGILGLDCAKMLSNIGYSVSGWSRSEKHGLPSAIKGFHGAAQLGAFLATCDTLICLLPLTNQTKGFLSGELFQQLPRGAHLINVGRGDHLIEKDLIPALDAGWLSVATLDTFSHEPLPPQHAFWADSRIVITPHIATRTDPEVIVRQTLHNLDLIKKNQVPTNQVDINLGY